MSDFFEKLGKQITETADTVMIKTSEALETQKIKSQIRTLERGNERDYADIGKIAYDKFAKTGTTEEDMATLCDTIKQREQQIEKLKQDLEAEKTTEKSEAEVKDAVKEKVNDVKEKAETAKDDLEETTENTIEAAMEKLDALKEEWKPKNKGE